MKYESSRAVFAARPDDDAGDDERVRHMRAGPRDEASRRRLERAPGYVRLPSDTLHRLVDSEGAFRQFVLGVLSGRVFEPMCALEETGSTQIEQRVARYLLKRCEPLGDHLKSGHT